MKFFLAGIAFEIQSTGSLEDKTRYVNILYHRDWVLDIIKDRLRGRRLHDPVWTRPEKGHTRTSSRGNPNYCSSHFLTMLICVHKVMHLEINKWPFVR